MASAAASWRPSERAPARGAVSVGVGLEADARVDTGGITGLKGARVTSRARSVNQVLSSGSDVG